MEHLNINLLINDLALILVLAAIASLVFKLLKQPAVLGYIVAGFLASPHFAFLPTVSSHENIEFWAQIGIIVLLFSLGLEFSFKKLLKVGGTAVLTALIIVVGMMGSGYLVGKLLGLDAINSIFLGGMISMSSTTIIIKALDDSRPQKRVGRGNGANGAFARTLPCDVVHSRRFPHSYHLQTSAPLYHRRIDADYRHGALLPDGCACAKGWLFVGTRRLYHGLNPCWHHRG